MNIEGVGPALVQQLLDEELIKDVADLYYLAQDELIELDRMGEKSSQNVIDALTESKDNSLAQVLFGLGIRHVGSRVAEVLAQNYNHIDKIIETPEEELIEIDEIGSTIAQSIVAYFKQEQNLRIIEKLKEAGVNFTSEVIERNSSLDGKRFVLTGKLNQFTRKEAKGRIKELGGRVTSSVSSKTDYLVVGDNPGSKYDKAQELGIKILDETEFKKLIEE